jgi:hypothetical protein
MGTLVDIETDDMDQTLRGLVMDCLRMSIHFFHPIQQCAQQVYHTALPLSPTSSQLHNSCLQRPRPAAFSQTLPRITDSQSSRVDTFSGAPNKWGLLLRTIDVKPRQLTYIATFAQSIIAVCEDIVTIYDTVTFVIRQSLHAPETVTRVQGSPDGSTLFFAHSSSVTMWDVQTGGLTHTFTTQSEITDIVISTMGDHIACGSSDGSVVFWNIHTKEEGKGFGNGQPVVTICWVSPQELAVATQNSVYLRDIGVGKTLVSPPIPGRVWGMVYLPMGRGGFVVGASRPGEGTGHELRCLVRLSTGALGFMWRSPAHPLQLLSPTVIGNGIVCVAAPSGVHSFNTTSYEWANSPPLLDAATSVAVSSNRNLVVQTKESIQIFSLGVLHSSEARNDVSSSHVYPLGEKHIICLLQPTRRLTLLELETLRELHPDDNTSTLGSLPTNQSPSTRASFSRGFVAEFGVSGVMEVWRSGTPLPEWPGAADEDPPLSGLSPSCARIATIYGSPRRELRVKNVKAGTILATLSLEHGDLATGNVYDVTFDSETRFHLKIDGPGRHVQIPYDIIPSPSGPHSHTIAKGEPVPLSEPRATPTYTLDANCEWVVDAESRKICWISPRDVRRGNGGHFWAGLSLVMVGDDGVVRKLTFREPDNQGIHSPYIG